MLLSAILQYVLVHTVFAQYIANSQSLSHQFSISL